MVRKKYTKTFPKRRIYERKGYTPTKTIDGKKFKLINDIKYRSEYEANRSCTMYLKYVKSCRIVFIPYHGFILYVRPNKGWKYSLWRETKQVGRPRKKRRR